MEAAESHIPKRPRPSTGATGPRQIEFASKIGQDHLGKELKVLWSPSIEESQEPPLFSFQVYLLPSALSVATDPKFLQKFMQVLAPSPREDFTEFSQACHLQLYCSPQLNILACVEHHRREVLHRQQHGKYQLVKSYSTGPWIHFEGFMLVIDSVDWMKTGLVFVGFDPADLKVEFPEGWEEQIHDDRIVLKAEKVHDVSETGQKLKEIWMHAGAWQAKINRPARQIRDEEIEETVAEPLRNSDIFVEMESADTDGVMVQPPGDDTLTGGFATTLVWHRSHGDTPPPYFYNLFISNGSSSVGKKPIESLDVAKLFASLNVGLLASVGWCLKIHDFARLPLLQGEICAKLTHARDSKNEESLNYEGGIFQHFQDIFIFLDSGFPQLACFNPVPYESYTIAAELDVEPLVEMIEIEGLKTLADRLHVIWSICRNRRMSPQSTISERSKITPKILINFSLSSDFNLEIASPKLTLSTSIYPSETGPITVHTLGTFFQSIQDAFVVIETESGAILPSPNPSGYHFKPFFDLQSLSWQSKNDSASHWLKTLTSTSGEEIVVPCMNLPWFQWGALQNGREYEIRLKSGLEIQRWSYGKKDALEGPFDLTPLSIESRSRPRFRPRGVSAPLQAPMPL